MEQILAKFAQPEALLSNPAFLHRRNRVIYCVSANIPGSTNVVNSVKFDYNCIKYVTQNRSKTEKKEGITLHYITYKVFTPTVATQHFDHVLLNIQKTLLRPTHAKTVSPAMHIIMAFNVRTREHANELLKYSKLCATHIAKASYRIIPIIQYQFSFN